MVVGQITTIPLARISGPRVTRGRTYNRLSMLVARYNVNGYAKYVCICNDVQRHDFYALPFARMIHKRNSLLLLPHELV